MKIKPILTEKSLKQAKEGLYSFWFLPSSTKSQIKTAISEAFNVKVGGVRTLNYKKEVKKSWRGKNSVKQARKKVLVTLKEGKIDLFEGGK